MDERIENSKIKEELIAAIRTRDDPFLRRFFDEHFPAIYRFLLCRVKGDHTLTEDLAHETFIHAFQHAHQLDAHHPPQAWLLGIARNLLRDHWRKKARRGNVVMALEDLHPEGIEAWPDPGVLDLPEALLERQEMAERVEEVLSELPPDYERILRNHYQEEKPVKAIAEALEITPKAAEARLFRARNAFREAFRALAGREDQVFKEVRNG